MPSPVEFVIDGTPVSQQTRRRSRIRDWIDEVKSLANDHWAGQPPFAGPVMVAITYFFDGVSLDVDNIPKPILDALKGIAYSDDSQVTDLLCRKRDLNGDLRFYDPPLLVMERLTQEHQFLYIKVNTHDSKEVSSW